MTFNAKRNEIASVREWDFGVAGREGLAEQRMLKFVP